ncbi:choice-of-anchor Q domain-containing protein [Wenzhouxiangella sp. EGI_FJ10409]|uniref:choice-of-anchor Q domain-containing protein n=1 Tax=Wenzhouxiangella sp. EGI_FJ10409 TaxID=3243767 RepID=UPI0035DD8ADC
MKFSKLGILRIRFSLPLLLGIWSMVAVSSADAATITVTNLNDSNAGSLRQAIADASSGDDIDFSVSGTIGLNSELSIDKNLTIQGGNSITVSGNDTTRVFRVEFGNTVSLDGLSIVNGRAASGGGVHNTGTLTVTNSTISDNSADGGGAGDGGGGIFSSGTLTVTNSTISNNIADAHGGGILSNTTGGSCTDMPRTVVQSSTISNNNTTGGGGGVRNTNGIIEITQSTITANSASEGGGVWSWNDGSTCTRIGQTIISGNSNTDVFGFWADQGYFSLGHNLIGTANSSVDFSQEFNEAGDLTNQTQPVLGDLANNGGLTRTNALLPGSPAIDAGPDTDCPAQDQRGVGRPQEGTCDIGAFESRGFDLVLFSGDNQSTTIGTDFSEDLAVDISSAFDDPVDGGQVSFLAPGSGASLSTEVSTVTIAGGQASITATANTIGGSYVVTAGTTGSNDTATFNLTNQFEVTASVVAGTGTISPANQTVDSGEVAAFTVAPGANWSVDEVTGDTCAPAQVAGNTWEAANIQDNCVVEAGFVINSYAVTAGVGAGNGQITPASQDVDHGSSASFTVTPDTGWSVSSVAGDNCSPALDSGSQWIATGITGACAVTAEFSVNSYTIGGTVSGFDGSGLVLQNNAGDDLTIGANGSFSFPTALTHGSTYQVTVLTQPTEPSQTCTVTNGSGQLNGADVDNVAVNCTTDTFSIGGTLSGLAQGSSVTLQNNGGDDLVLSADGSFSFATALDDLSNYSVTVLTQPSEPSQTCTVSNGSGQLDGADVDNVNVSCTTDTFSVGGTLSGLATDSSITLQNNGGDDLVLSADGSFSFATALDDLSNYSVTVLTQPTEPSQTCTVSNGSGQLDGADVDNVNVSCTTDTFSIGGTLSGLATDSSITLQNNGGDDLVLSADGNFSFATSLDDLSNYAVTVLTQPTEPSQTCTVSNGSGQLDGADVDNVNVSCTTDTFSVGGTLSGLAQGSSVTLQNNGGDDLVLSADGSFSFATALDDLSNYSVTVLTQPSEPSQTCTVSNGSGQLDGADVDNVNVSCTTDTFSVGGTLSGLAQDSSVTLQNNDGDDLVLSANGDFTFATSLDDLSDYAVTVLTQPTEPSQTCTVSNGSGQVDGTDVDNVDVSCTTDTFSIGGTLSGLANDSSVTLQNNDGDDIVLSADGDFTFATVLDDLSNYEVTVSSQPDGQQCSVANASGTLDGDDIENVEVNCADIVLELSVTDIEFTNLEPGETEEQTQTLTLSNPGSADLVIEEFTQPAEPFGFDAMDCAPLPHTLPPGESCTVELSFTPGDPGDFSDQLLIVSNGMNSPGQVAIAGSYTLPVLPVPAMGLPALLTLLFGMLLIGMRQMHLNSARIRDTHGL